MKPKKKKQKTFMEEMKALPKFWRDITMLGLGGVAVGLVSMVFLGAYLGLILLFFAVSIPIAWYTHAEMKRISDIEKHLPDFLRDLAEYNTSGMPLSQAILQASKSDYGALTPEIKKMADEISWGVPFEESLERLKKRVKSPFVSKAISIIVTAESQGGEITSILKTLAEDLRKINEMEEDRKGKLSVYTATIYVIFLLLLGIMVMLTATLAPAIPKMQVAGQFFGGATGGLTETDFRVLLFHVSLIEAFFAGLISGQMGEGSAIAGLKHSVILVAITLLAFSLVPPSPPVYKIAESIIEIPPVKGVQGSMVAYESVFKESFTSTDVADKVRDLAKSMNRKRLKTFAPDQVEFIATTCTPCQEGKVSISKYSVKVKEPARLKYKVSYSNGKYIVEISDAT